MSSQTTPTHRSTAIHSPQLHREDPATAALPGNFSSLAATTPSSKTGHSHRHTLEAAPLRGNFSSLAGSPSPVKTGTFSNPPRKKQPPWSKARNLSARTPLPGGSDKVTRTPTQHQIPRSTGMNVATPSLCCTCSDLELRQNRSPRLNRSGGPTSSAGPGNRLRCIIDRAPSMPGPRTRAGVPVTSSAAHRDLPRSRQGDRVGSVPLRRRATRGTRAVLEPRAGRAHRASASVRSARQRYRIRSATR